MTLLAVRRLSARYGSVPVLSNVDLEVAQGGVTAVLGANGAGKTTLLRAISGMIARRGEIAFDGVRIDAMAPEDIARLGLGHVPDGRGTFASLTTEENLRLGAYTRTPSPAVDRDFAKVYRYFPRLAERRRQQAGTLSGGEQQMLAIGRALMLAPKLLVLDEPSFGLAPRIIDEIFGILRQIKAEHGTGVLLVEQNAHLALELADRAYLLETGCVVKAGTPDELRGDEAIRRAYLGN
jgi:branched-chain amino acid transport system ATP-binding protein